MNGVWKISPWLLLITGVFCLVVGLRDHYVPSQASRRGLAPYYLVGGALCLVVGVGGLRRSKR